MRVQSACPAGGEQPAENLIVLAKIAVERIGEEVCSRSALRQRVDARREPDRHELLRVTDGKLTNQDRVDEGEDRGVRADANREGAHDDRGEADVAAQRAKCVHQVLSKLGHHICSPHRSLSLLVHGDAVLTHRTDVAELAQGLLSRAVRIPAGIHESLHSHLEMERELVVDLPRDVRPGEWQSEDASHDVSGRRR